MCLTIKKKIKESNGSIESRLSDSKLCLLSCKWQHRGRIDSPLQNIYVLPSNHPDCNSGSILVTFESPNMQEVSVYYTMHHELTLGGSAGIWADSELERSE